ncbi:unnamed protein product [Closterium sp. Naga37s-1]|nr:unnamed protein product [Closterium sp. Naga37s-1]
MRGGWRSSSSAHVHCQASSSAAARESMTARDDGCAGVDEAASRAPAAVPPPLAADPPPQTVTSPLAATAPAAIPGDSVAAAAPAPTPAPAASATTRAAVPSPNPTGEVGTTSPGKEAAEGVEPKHAEKERFEWSRAWYAVGVVANMEASRPHALTVLVRPLVLWRDASLSWRCFLDQCPHRLVPLSEDRIDSSGRLACSYHGWAFAGSGACHLIPQVPQDNPPHPPRALASSRACATAFPTRELHGILFVWPDNASVEQAERTAIPEPEGVEWDAFDMIVRI